MQIIKVGAARFERDGPALQDALKKLEGTEMRPLCCCTSPAPQMVVAYVRERDKFILRRMPNSGHLHAFICPSFAPVPELSGLADVLGTAVVTLDDGVTVVRLGFSLDQRPSRGRSPSAGAGVPGGLKSNPAELGMIGNLHGLWNKARLATSYPGRSDKPSWREVRNGLLDAARRTRTRSVEFGKRVFVPPPFFPEREDELARERDAFFHSLEAGQLGILIAEFKYRHDRKLYFKHLPRFPFFLERGASERFDRKFADRIELKDEVEGAHLIAIATFSYNRGFCNVVEIDMMPVTAEWIPFEHPREAELIKALRERKFVKSLRYNLSASAPMASATLYDTDGPTALYAPPADISADAEKALRAAAERAPCRTWFWPASSPRMPALPPKVRG